MEKKGGRKRKGGERDKLVAFSPRFSLLHCRRESGGGGGGGHKQQQRPAVENRGGSIFLLSSSFLQPLCPILEGMEEKGGRGASEKSWQLADKKGT